MEDRANAQETLGATIIKGSEIGEVVTMKGIFHAKCYDKDGNFKWEDEIKNTVCTQGKAYIWNTIMTGTSLTASSFMGLIAGTTGAVQAGDTMASHGNWQEAGSNAPLYSTRAPITASWVTTTIASIALNSGSPASFTVGTTGGTANGCFVVLQGSATNANTTGNLLSAGYFTAGKPLSPSDQLQVSYSIAM